MKKWIYIISILFYQIIVFAQIKVDTIDYKAIIDTNSYRLKKITAGKFDQVLKLKPYAGTTVFMISNTLTKTQSLEMFRDKKVPVNDNDTIMYLEFDLENQSELYNGHQWGIVHINHKSNVLILDKISFVTKKQIRRLFKIYKLTKSEIILKDISNLKLNRTYYLH